LSTSTNTSVNITGTGISYNVAISLEVLSNENIVIVHSDFTFLILNSDLSTNFTENKSLSSVNNKKTIILK
jgi:hypothetical protein